MIRVVFKCTTILLILAMVFPMSSVAAGSSEYYDDVPGWATEYVDYCYENGMLYGTGEKQFSPNQKVSLNQICTILYRLAGEPEFEECKNLELLHRKNGRTVEAVKGDWCYAPLHWAAGNDFFSYVRYDHIHCSLIPSRPYVMTHKIVTRNEVVEQLYSLVVEKGAERLILSEEDFDLLDRFTDIEGYECLQQNGSEKATFDLSTGERLYSERFPGVSKTPINSARVSEYWVMAVRDGIINGRENDTLAMKETLTRAELATILTRFYEVYGSCFE